MNLGQINMVFTWVLNETQHCISDYFRSSNLDYHMILQYSRQVRWREQAMKSRCLLDLNNDCQMDYTCLIDTFSHNRNVKLQTLSQIP